MLSTSLLSHSDCNFSHLLLLLNVVCLLLIVDIILWNEYHYTITDPRYFHIHYCNPLPWSWSTSDQYLYRFQSFQWFFSFPIYMISPLNYSIFCTTLSASTPHGFHLHLCFFLSSTVVYCFVLFSSSLCLHIRNPPGFKSFHSLCDFIRTSTVRKTYSLITKIRSGVLIDLWI